jgi:hypothetical protein
MGSKPGIGANRPGGVADQEDQAASVVLVVREALAGRVELAA